MTRILGVVVIGLALVAAGCGPIAVLESGGSADSVAMLPGEVALSSAADEAYQFEATLGYESGSLEHLGAMVGPTPGDADEGVISLGFTWYFLGAVENDDVPVELQPLDQKASSLSVGYATGSIEPDSGSDVDESAFAVAAKYILGEDTPVDGLGFELSYSSATIEDIGSPDLDATKFRFGALYYIPVGDTAIIAKLGYSSETYDDGGAAEPNKAGIDLGAQYYVAVGDGMYLDAELTLAFLTMDWDDGSDDEDIFRYLLSVDFYPMKFLGFGLDYGNDSWDVTGGDLDESTFGLHVVWNVEQVPGLDLELGYSSDGLDAGAAGDWDNSAITFSADYRF